MIKNLLKSLNKLKSDRFIENKTFTQDQMEMMFETGKGYDNSSFQKFEYILWFSKYEFVKELAQQLGNDVNGNTRKIESEEAIGIKDVDNMNEILKNTNLGFDISRILKHQLALRHKNYGKTLFNLNYLEKKLLQLNYVSEMEEHTITPNATKQLFEYEDNGPIILVIDTSASMMGYPELVAKACAYEITRVANEGTRDVYLINFSSTFTCFELTNNNTDKDNLIKFLLKSFRGGTNSDDALIEATKVLQKENYHHADVLFISDFITNFNNEEMLEAVKEAKNKGSKFYGLIIDQISCNDKQAGIVKVKPFDCCFKFDGKNTQDHILYQQLIKNRLH